MGFWLRGVVEKKIQIMKKIHLGCIIRGFKSIDELSNEEKHFSEIAPDSALTNRLFHWNEVYNISRYHNFEYKIYVEKKWWPELEYIDLPNTICFDYGYDLYETYKKDKEEFLIENNIQPINNLDLCFSDEFKNINEYYTNFLYSDGSYLINYKAKKNIAKIKFKNDKVNEYIKNKCNNLIGIHIRRGNGVFPPELGKRYEDVLGISGVVKEEDMDIIPYMKKYEFCISDAEPIPRYISNEYYVNLIKSILEKNKNQKFYISYDVDDKFIELIINKFKESIYTKNDLYKDIGNIIENKFTKWPNNSVLGNLIDLFSLINCKSFIPFPISSWSTFVKNYNNNTLI